MSPFNIEVTARGEVSEHAKQQAREKISALERFVNSPILGARVVLVLERNPRIPQPARAEAEIELKGRVIRAHADALTVEAAIDEVSERMQRQLRSYVDRIVTRKRERAEALKEQSHSAGSQT
ncbi:MAG TPA: ribosome-associated translation inhibitor RaiA [Solirubrobacteraceae bacterium]|nr:ribosome-associated translation inhibitor RaiA [Solirubrobacteraceae bacterium]